MTTQVKRIAIIFSLFYPGCADEPVQEPLLVLGQEALDLGEQLPNRRQKIAVQMLNHGTGPLTIHELRTSCTCSDAKVSTESIDSGEHGELWIDVTPRSLGTGMATVTVVSNCATRPLQTFKVEWDCVDAVGLERHSIDFGEVRPGQVVTRDVVFNYRPQLLQGDGASRVVAVDGLTDGLEFHGSLPFELKDAGLSKIGSLSLAAGTAPGHNAARVTVEIDGAVKQQLPMLVTWEVVKAVSVVPERLSLGEVQIGSTDEQTGEIIIRSKDAELVLGNVSVSDDWVEANIETMAATIARCRVRRTNDLPVGIHSADITIAVTEPEVSTLRIPVSLIVSEREEGSP